MRFRNVQVLRSEDSWREQVDFSDFLEIAKEECVETLIFELLDGSLTDILDKPPKIQINFHTR